VGQSIRIPPPEALDRSLIEPARPAPSSASLETANASTSPTSGATASAPMRRASRSVEANKAGSSPSGAEAEVALPTSDPFAKRGEGSAFDDVPSRLRTEVRRPRYKVRPYETLRSIARDTLGDSHRADEILELNEEVIDDPAHLIVGQVLELPEDAKVGSRRAR
jgi:nucleoid-associated protein YgaU